jgi:hypothetical protein
VDRPPESRQAWSEAIASAKQQGALDKAPVFLAERLDQKYDFDAIVMPSILVHKGARQRRRRGLERRLPADGALEQTDTMPPLAQGPTEAKAGHVRRWNPAGGITGDVLVTSVHVMVFSRAGSAYSRAAAGSRSFTTLDMSKAREGWTGASVSAIWRPTPTRCARASRSPSILPARGRVNW